MPPVTCAVVSAILVISAVTLALYAIDKYRARRGLWRIPERVLLTLSILGGGLGGIAAMYLFRHKTRHFYFTAANILGILLSLSVIAASVLLP